MKKPSFSRSSFADVRLQVRRLMIATKWMRMLSSLMILISAFQVLLFVVTFAEHTGHYLIPGSQHIKYSWIGLGALVFLMIAVFGFEQCRRGGELLFQEISDELQWKLRPSKFRKEGTTGASLEDKPGSETEVFPSIDFRIALREFVQQSELPLVKSSFGPLVYLAVNFALVLGVVLYSQNTSF